MEEGDVKENHISVNRTCSAQCSPFCLVMGDRNKVSMTVICLENGANWSPDATEKKNKEKNTQNKWWNIKLKRAERLFLQ